MKRTREQSVKFKSVEEYEKTFYPLEKEQLEVKGANARHFGTCLARELLDKYKKSEKAKP